MKSENCKLKIEHPEGNSKKNEIIINLYKFLCENDSHEKFNEFCNLFMRLYF